MSEKNDGGAAPLTIAIGPRMAAELREWLVDEMAHWPSGTAYHADLADLKAEIDAMLAAREGGK